MVRGKIWLKTKIIVIISILLCSLFLPLAPVYAGTGVSVIYHGSRTPTLQTAAGCPSLSVSSAYCLNNTQGGAVIGATNIYWSSGMPLNPGQMLEITITVYNVENNNSLDTYTTRLPSTVSGGGNIIYYYAGGTYQQLSASSGQIKYLFYVQQAHTSYQILFPSAWIELKPNEAFSVDSVVAWAVNVPSSGGSGGDVQWVNLRPHLDSIQLEIRQKTNEIGDLMRAQQTQNQNIVNNLEQINNTYTTEQQQAEQDGQQSQTDAETAGTDAEQATQSLISVVGDFFGAFINAQATTCEFNMGIILENVNLCAAYIPSVYNVILSIVSILMLVPMVLWLLSSISNAFKEFQQ